MATFALGVVVGFLIGGSVIGIICRAGLTQAEFEQNTMRRLWEDAAKKAADAASRYKGW